MTMLRSVILGCGSYLPARVVPNEELAARVDTTDEWIVQRTGIRQRHLAGPDETTSSLGLKADYAVAQNLAGVMFWELSQDAAQHRLLQALHSHLGN